MSPFLAWGDFHARSRFARPTIPEEKWGTTRSLPRVLIALIQFATMATEVVEVATESEEDVIINCVAIFYEEGKEGENFRRAVRFNNRLLH